MASKKPKTVLYRRRREQKTDYKKKMKILLSKKPRLVVRFTNQKIIAQIITFCNTGDKVEVGIDSSHLKKLGWDYSLKSIPAAYLTGLVLGKSAQKKGIKEAVFDTGFRTPLKGGKINAFLKGVIETGLNVPYGEKEIFPSEGRINGKHVQDYAKLLKENKEIYGQRFGKYLKNKLIPEEIVEIFNKTKEKIMS